MGGMGFYHSLVQYPGGCLNLTRGGMCTCDDKGRRCSAKNQVSVGCCTENHPQTHPLRVCAREGMAERRLGWMAVASQNGVWPHGSTQPMKGEQEKDSCVRGFLV